ncbi:uncharacterized protein C7orf57 homolog [Brachionichthys hirsutus]|uniref:uncharacterized protein C7orf57 homolog n=1 Tax=Brachionichthys hirsutus TaxID=412623 RepID=UPI00360515D9
MSAAVPNHRRTKPGGIKPAVVTAGVTGPTSQIPGLSQSADESTPAERTSGRRVGIFATDSEYVKLAKGGGHKGLLSHDADADDQPRMPYNPPGNWFGVQPQSENDATSPDGPMKRQTLTAPFGTDGSSIWERETDTMSPDKGSPDGVAGQMEALSVSNQFKRTSYDKKALPVSMSKLLSHGYVERKKASPDDDDASSVTSEQASTILTEDLDDAE